MMNRQMNLPAMQKILMEFEIQTEKMDMKEEMMNDTMEEVCRLNILHPKSQSNTIYLLFLFISNIICR